MTSTVGCVQPSYMPWIPFFKRFINCDYFVILDDVDYSKNSNQNRNYINMDNQHKMLTRSKTNGITKEHIEKKTDKTEHDMDIVDDTICKPSKLNRLNLLKNTLLNIYDLNLEDEDEDEEEVEYDEFDEEFVDMTVDDVFEDKNLTYFKNLDPDNKKKILTNIKSLNEINERDVPIKFKILNSEMPEDTKAYALALLEKLEGESGEDEHKMRKWIEGLISIPFGKFITLGDVNDRYIIDVHKCLNKAIYGHKEAKCHILQLVARWMKNPSSNGNILAIQGPMGNGKTTLVKDGIAKALNRPFAFISLGGASDSSYLNGHSLTYEGSVCGRIVDVLIKSKCMNPIIYFDELDKVSETPKGEEIINLLTHLTDFSQNDRFQDNYFAGINLDLSKVLFIFSFNDENKVNRILKDRMYVINTKGFKCLEKIKIANEYLLPKLYNSFKFSDKDIIFPNSIIETIINNYTNKEEGVRNLLRCLETILSKLNIYNMYSLEEEDVDLELPYKIDDFKIPYTLTPITLTKLLTLNNKGSPPEHMYL